MEREVLTASQVESRYRDVARGRVADFVDVRAARTVADQVWQSHGLSGFGSLLSEPGTNAKLAKSRARTLTGLSLMPSDFSGIADVCPWSGLCRESCVAFSGNGRYTSTTKGRTARTDLFVNHPVAFVTLLIDELRRMESRFGLLGVRLNTYSDVRWERILPADFWSTFRRVSFYDYTKHSLRSRPVESMPKNYRLTYSYSEKTRPADVSANVVAGRNVAVVLSVRSGKDRRTGAYRPIPRELFGLPMVDGDRVDDRYRDRVGVVVGLRRKHTLSAGSAFVVGV